jgi:Reverse transcriptase (RNA-dependent DNA polymerase)
VIPPRSTGTEESREEPDDDEVVEAIYLAVTSDLGVPQTFEEAFFGPNKKFWRPAIYEELMRFISRIFKKRNKQQIIQQLKRKIMTTKWIFKEKINPDGTIKYKARCVSRGFMQIPGVDYTESFAPVASDSGIRIVIGIFLYYLHHSPQDNWVLESFDVEVAFLNAMLSHPVYIKWPNGIKEFGFLEHAQTKVPYN